MSPLRLSSWALMAAVLFGCSSLTSAGAASEPLPLAGSEKDHFKLFQRRYGKAYASETEEAHRFTIFQSNLRKAHIQQEMNPQATFGVTPFMDLTLDEMRRHHMNGKRTLWSGPSSSSSVSVIPSSEKPAYAHDVEKFHAQRRRMMRSWIRSKKGGQGDAAAMSSWEPLPSKLHDMMPDAIDWRTIGGVTPVKNQGQCGSCWAFSTTGNFEGQWWLAGNNLTSLAEQEFVSCDPVDRGCDGGDPDITRLWLLYTHQGGAVSEASYPYTSGDTEERGVCNETIVKDSKNVVSTLIGTEDIPTLNETAMREFAWSRGPVGICLDGDTFQTYTGGIITNCTMGWIDHCVLVVGYNVSGLSSIASSSSPGENVDGGVGNATVPYWIIKNSWGESWGENGYVRVAYGSDQCYLSVMPSSARVEDSKAPGGSALKKSVDRTAAALGLSQEERNRFPLRHPLWQQ